MLIEVFRVSVRYALPQFVVTVMLSVLEEHKCKEFLVTIKGNRFSISNRNCSNQLGEHT